MKRRRSSADSFSAADFDIKTIIRINLQHCALSGPCKEMINLIPN